MFQQSVSAKQGFGCAGDLYSDQPRRAESFQVNAATEVARMMSVVSEGVCTPGGVAGSILAGIIFNRQVYANRGTTGNPLAPNLVIAQYTQVECLKEGELVIPLAADAAIGDGVIYDAVTGVLESLAAGTANLPAGKVNAYGRIVRFTPDAGGAQLAVAHFNIPVEVFAPEL